MRQMTRWIGVLSVAMTLAACSSDDDATPTDSGTTDSGTTDGGTTDSAGTTDGTGGTDGGEPTAWDIATDLQGLDALSEGEYEGWLIYGDEKVSTGRFSDPADADMTTDRDPADADAFVLTIEPDEDADPGPSGIVALSGPIGADGMMAELSFGADLTDAAGGFILRTPTDDGPTSWALDLAIEGLEDLTQGAYEGWLIFGEEKVSVGVFTEGAAASLSSTMNPADSDAFVVTIEPTPDTDPGPSGVVVLSGTVVDGVADLTLPVDLSAAAGGFILRAPTDDATNVIANDEAGVWFLEMGAEGPMVGMDLPALPDGWVYEGWAVTQGVPLTSGRFVDPAMADFASPYSDGGPPFPGEDFLLDLPDSIILPVNLADGESTIVISVEPDIEGVDPTGDGPFAIKPLALPIPMNHALATYTELGAGPSLTVTGTLTVTGNAAPANDEAGIWFLEIGDAGPMVGLTLPELPDGWVYEGWAVTQGVPLTSGRFVDPAMADMASPYSDGGPPFPGEDFLMNLPMGITAPVNLNDGASTVVISIEPDMAGVDPTGDGPFAIKPLALPVPMDLAGATYAELGAGPSGAPTGTATFSAAE
ncbi:MAG: hypothetical protein ACI9WU_000337 [Myxococcota bacterium]|jgi:hypothetical protein